MTKAKRSTKRNARRAALALGAAGVSFAMTGGASATAPTSVASQDDARRIFLGEEEIDDVSLATFHVFDKEGDSRLRQGIRVAAGHGGCGGCGHGGGCGGCAHGGGCGCARIWAAAAPMRVAAAALTSVAALVMVAEAALVAAVAEAAAAAASAAYG